MLFDEVYGSYYQAVAEILKEAIAGELTEKRMEEIVREKAFAESVLTIPEALKSGTWPLLRPDFTTPLLHAPAMPLTTLQKRWLKALLSDPRIRLFSPSDEGLETVEPLYSQRDFVFYDRYSDGDSFEDARYIENFRIILTALREKRRLRIRFCSHLDRRQSWVCIPRKLEYSSKDDKFRLIAETSRSGLTVNLARIKSCELLDSFSPEECKAPPERKKTLVLELMDERNALERVMLHFSHLEKETERLDENRYRMTLRYDREDETEMLIRVLSFGPVIKVLSPDSFIDKLRERLNKQNRLRAQN